MINILVNEATEVFLDNRQSILEGSFNDTLMENMDKRSGAFRSIQEISINKIYGHDTVMQIEIAGYNVMSELLQLFVPALLMDKPSHKQEKVLRLFPFQLTEFLQTESKYKKVLNALDYLSGMTDEYATEMYRRLKGIVIPLHS